MVTSDESLSNAKERILRSIEEYVRNRKALREAASKVGKEDALEQAYKDLKASYDKIVNAQLAANEAGYDALNKQINLITNDIDSSIKSIANIDDVINNLNKAVKFVKSIFPLI
jgi:archaellum component FlaC